MRNKYRNLWWKSLNTDRPEFYENEAPCVFEYRGVKIYKLWNKAFDCVLDGACIAQRAGFDKTKAITVIDELLDGKTPTCDEVAAHLSALGFSPLTYEQYTQKYLAGEMA